MTLYWQSNQKLFTRRLHAWQGIHRWACILGTQVGIDLTPEQQELIWVLQA